ncbi:MAG TPA: hypothetical protein VH374_25375 [Polyangia bacterium]|jgi:hypothetical protein|nr:hypothetical protein [Polyangia bacterium]
MMSTDETAFDPTRRRLCPDGACVGLIGDEGRCKVCGMPAGPDHDPAAADSGAITWDSGGKDENDDMTLPRTLGDVARLDEASGFNPDRQLCSDGTCLGVIGADGRCNVCGKPAE